MKINNYIDHTLLRPDATIIDIERLCQEAFDNNFASVCVHSLRVRLCAQILKDSAVKVCSVVGFPFGANLSMAKSLEAGLAIKEGADEIDMVMNIGAFKDKRLDIVLEDIRAVKEAIGDKILKVIIETCLLDNKAIALAARIVTESGADYIKTSTGYGGAGATVEHVKLLKNACQDKIKIKAAGGIKTRKFALELIGAGADRLGCSSSIELIKGE